MDNRLLKIRTLLEKFALGALLISSEANRFYASGLRSSAGVVLLTRTHNLLITDFRYIEAAKEAAFGSFEVVEATPKRGYTDIIKGALGKTKRFGVESNVLTLREAKVWSKDYKLVPLEEELMLLRASKDSGEIEKIIAAQRIAEQVFLEILNIIRPGMTEKEILAEIIYRALKNGAEKMSFDPIVASGPNGSKPHAKPTARAIQRGDFLTLDFGCVYEGYCSDMTRTIAVAEASGKMREIYELVLKAQLAGISAAKAGVSGSDIDFAARNIIESAGYGKCFGHGFGHGLGILVHEPPNANRAEKRPLPKGAVISAEPGIYLPKEFGVRIEDLLLLTDGGAKNLTKSEKGLIVV